MISLWPRLLSIMGAILLVFLVGCGKPRDESSGAAGTAAIQSPSEAHVLHEPPIDWSNPIDGVTLADISDAERAVAFEVGPVRGLGRHSKILLSRPEWPMAQRVLALLFDTDSYGRVVLIRHRAEMSKADFITSSSNLESMNGDPNVHGTFDRLTIRGDKPALLTASEDGAEATLFWYENGLEFIVRGPQIGPATALEIAEKI